MKVLFCVVLLTVGAVVKAQQDYPLPDYYDNNYDTYDNYNDALIDSNENTEVKEVETAQPGEIQDVQEEPEPEKDEFADYQIEDNRSESTEKEQDKENNEEIAEETVPSEASVSEEAEEHRVLPLEQSKQSNEESEDLGLDADAWDGAINDDVVPLPVPETEDSNNDNIFEETKDILNQGQDYLDELDQLAVDDDKDIDQIIEETNKLLAEDDETFDANDYDNSNEQEKSDDDVLTEKIEEDTPAKVIADLNSDLDKLFETFDKLGVDESEETDEEAADNDKVQDYEEKYGKPYKEDVALSWRNAEVDADEPEESEQNDETADENNDEVADENDDEVVDENNNEVVDENNDEVVDENNDEVVDENNDKLADDKNDAVVDENNDEVTDENNDEVADGDIILDQAEDGDDYEVIDDSNLSKIFAENANLSNENDAKETAESLDKIDEVEPIEYAVGFDGYDKLSDFEPNADDEIDSLIKQILADDVKEPEKTQSYGNDGLVDENQPKEKDAAEFESVEEKTGAEEEVTQKTVMVDDLNSAELSDLMTQFVAVNKEMFDVNSENFASHVKPIHITLSVDEPTVITSPDYPEFYPTNNIVDWVFDGPGTGIELNITDFDINGAVNDYLLVKPGGIDHTGNDGLIFSYHLNSVRKYRFADVNRMFVRFQTFGNWPFKRGFSFSVKLIWPLPTFGDEEPEAEAVAEPPKETLTLNLAGLTLLRFNEIKDDFLELLAAMAKEYIKDNNITLGLNTTYEVTQITRTAVCNIQWPEYENCVEVTFGVPLQYEEEPEEPRLNAEDLNDMWTSYIIKEQFSERLRSLGITEYAIPSDRTVLMVWLVIAGGVIISMAMLAFALWRFSCFEDYTRMQQYGDTDSIQNEKRHLDLYPTPHQTLPPLYSENDYKWADDKYDDSTRVDMGGLANRSYIQDDLYDLDSDEDVIPPRDRYTTNV